jgi:hypothetical protein
VLEVESDSRVRSHDVYERNVRRPEEQRDLELCRRFRQNIQERRLQRGRMCVRRRVVERAEAMRHVRMRERGLRTVRAMV